MAAQYTMILFEGLCGQNCVDACIAHISHVDYRLMRSETLNYKPSVRGLADGNLDASRAPQSALLVKSIPDDAWTFRACRIVCRSGLLQNELQLEIGEDVPMVIQHGLTASQDRARIWLPLQRSGRTMPRPGLP